MNFFFICDFCCEIFADNFPELRHACRAVNDFFVKLGTFDENGFPELIEYNVLYLAPTETKKIPYEL